MKTQQFHLFLGSDDQTRIEGNNIYTGPGMYSEGMGIPLDPMPYTTTTSVFNLTRVQYISYDGHTVEMLVYGYIIQEDWTEFNDSEEGSN